MRAPLVAALLGASVFVSSAAFGQAKDSDWDGDFSAKRGSRRSDFTLGLSGGLHIGSATGYPNEIDKIDNRQYRAKIDNTVGLGASAWLGVAFNDWLTFAAGVSTVHLASEDLAGSGGAAFARVETFPLFPLGGAFRDIGLSGNFGLAYLKFKAGSDEKADGGTMSVVGFGGFYEPLRVGPVAIGPLVEYTHWFSLSAKLDSMLYGVRVAFYTSPLGGSGSAKSERKESPP